MEHTRNVAEFVVGTRFAALSPSVVTAAKDAVRDTLGVALAGSGEEAGAIAAEMAREEGSRAEAAVLGHGFRAAASTAAFANGVATHAMDYDASFTTMGQPMASITAAVLALAEARQASGGRLLEAYVVGYEVAAKIAWALPAGSNRGWHATGTLGTMGATAAAARLLDLDAGRTCCALGIATSMASGVVWNFGTMSKPLHAGLGARNGVAAARLAEKGFTATTRTLDGAEGFFGAFAPGLAPNLDRFGELGVSFEIEGGVKYKAYPCGGLTHTGIDAALALRREHGLSAEEVDRIDVLVTSDVAERIIYRVPQTELQAKFSMPYVVARALIDGAVTPDMFSDEEIADPGVVALAERVFMEANPAFDERELGARPCELTVRLKDGRTLSKKLLYPKGSTQVPFSKDELRSKFHACARRVLGDDGAARAIELIDRLEALSDARELGQALLGPTR
jgi:2-methylcitrate dehydratase PrpD